MNSGLPQDLPAFEGGGALLAQGADGGVVTVRQLLAFAEPVALAAFVQGADRAGPTPDMGFVCVAG
ncbi:hypothetical protein GCM10010402_82090 [Actinomadura luteofluorescens]